MMRRILLLRSLLIAVLALSGAAAGEDAELEKLRKRFAERYPTLVALQRAGKVGERFDGYVAVVERKYRDDPADPDKEKGPTVAELLEAENADRSRLYRILAERLEVPPEKVARRNAARNFEKAEPKMYLKPGPDADWLTKKAYEKRKDD